MNRVSDKLGHTTIYYVWIWSYIFFLLISSNNYLFLICLWSLTSIYKEEEDKMNYISRDFFGHPSPMGGSNNEKS